MKQSGWIDISHDKGECLMGILYQFYHITQENFQEAYGMMDWSHNTRKVLIDIWDEPVTQHRSMIKEACWMEL
jgi:hypothetical protein